MIWFQRLLQSKLTSNTLLTLELASSPNKFNLVWRQSGERKKSEKYSEINKIMDSRVISMVYQLADGSCFDQWVGRGFNKRLGSSSVVRWLVICKLNFVMKQLLKHLVNDLNSY